MKFCAGIILSSAETLIQIQNSDILTTCGKTFVCKWHERLRKGRKSLFEDERPGRPTASVTTGNVKLVKELIHTDRRIMVQDVAKTLSLSPATVHRILNEQVKCQTCRLVGCPAPETHTVGLR